MTTHDNSDTQTQPTVEQHIAAARARWDSRQQQIEASRVAQEAAKQQAEAAVWQQTLDSLAQMIPPWVLEYIDPEYATDYESGITEYYLNLPGCSPIILSQQYGSVNHVFVVQPLAVKFDDYSEQWYVTRERSRYDMNADLFAFDAAVSTAAGLAETWAAMLAEANRRNNAGERPSLPPPADPISQAIDTVSRLCRNDSDMDYADDFTLVTVGRVIAHHLSRLADAAEKCTHNQSF